MKKTSAQKKTTRAARPAAKKPAAKPARSARPAAPARKPAPAAKARVAPAAPARQVAKAVDQEVTAPGRKVKVAPAAAVRPPPRPAAPPAPPKRVVPKMYEKPDVERAAKAILKALRPLVSEEEDNDPEAVGRRLSLEAAHPRRRSDGHYEVFLRYNSGSALGDPEAEAEGRSRRWFDERSEYPGIPVAVDVNVLEDREN